MNHAVIIDALRSPMARSREDSAFAQLHPTALLSQVIQQLVEQNNLDPGTVDDVITGCVSQVGEQASMPGRVAWLAAGYPEHVPSTVVDRRCGSSQQAVHFAAQAIMAGVNDIVIACGIESMSRVPMGSSVIGKNPYSDEFIARYAPGLVPQGISSDLVAAKWNLTRQELDEFAYQSHQRADKTREAGGFTREIVPIKTVNCIVKDDETIRPDTTIERLSTLKPAFYSDEMATRFPEIGWLTTAGNSSQISDGASALLIMSEKKANELGLTPRARFVSFDVYGNSPLMMLTAPIPSTQRAIEKSGLSLDDIDHFEVNEAFASVPLAWLKNFPVDPARLNPRGGAIALGHPLGASGARIMTTLLHALEDNKQRYGLQTMCEAGGMSNTTIIERL